MRVAVIGAGLAGAAAARVFKQAGASVTLFDKGRGPGGRLSTRRADTPLGEMRFDHGAQYVTAKSDSLKAFLAAAGDAGAAAPWRARLVSIDRGGNLDELRGEERWIGVPGMNALVKFALDGFDVQLGRRAKRMTGEPGAWTLRFEDGSTEGPFDRVALTLPPEQLIDFLARSDGDFARLIAAARQVEIAPCWTVMAALDQAFDPGFDGAKLLGGAVRWMALTQARPGGMAGGVVLQASPDWSDAFLENPAEDVARILCEEVFVRFGMPSPVWTRAHRWRYAMVTTPAGSPADLSDSQTVGCGGDWRLGGKAESAWQSGEALGEALIG
jgi:renalase